MTQAPPPGSPPQGQQPGPAGYGPPPGWQPPKQGHTLRNLGIGCGGLIALVIVIVIVMMASSSNSGTKVSNNGASGSGGGHSTSGSSPQTFKVGDTVKVGDNLYVTVTDAKVITSGNEFETPVPGGEFLLVNIAFQNKGSSPATVSSVASFELRDATTGQSYQETFVGNAPKPPDGEVAAGDRLAGGLTYDVPTGKPYKLYFKNDVFSGGAVVIDLGTR